MIMMVSRDLEEQYAAGPIASLMNGWLIGLKVCYKAVTTKAVQATGIAEKHREVT
jgi:hypothetical protein